MELRHLRYFMAVVEEGSFTTAAERRLHTSQPSLSRQIRDLEYEVGTELLSRSSYGVGRSLEKDGSSLEARMGLPPRDHASHGGSVPIFATSGACIGAVTVSGLPQRDDHSLVVEAMAAMCGVPLSEIALP